MKNKQLIIDCDLHNTYVNQSVLYPYLSVDMLNRIKSRGLGYSQEVYHKTAGGKRLDAFTDEGATAGSSCQKIIDDWIAMHGIDYAVLSGEGIIGISSMPNSDVAEALSSAYNSWLVEEWLPRDNRFLGSLHLAIQNPDHAVAEIYKWAHHTQIVQVTLPVATTLPLSHKFYRPILKALNDTGLVLSLHFKQPTPNNYSSTPLGLLNSYFAWHSLICLPYQTQMVDLIASGVFEELTELKIILLEGGFTWAPHLMWRMDKEYKALWQEIPRLKKLPSEYVHDHFRFGIQPKEEAQSASHIQSIVNMMGAETLLIYAGDYPHWDADTPMYAMQNFNLEHHHNILYQNAADIYKINH
jgi:uncharacterized protein